MGATRRRGRLAWMAVLCVIALAVAACDAASSQETDPGEPVAVATTFSVLADLAEAVGGERVEVTSIVPVGGDPHDYESTPSDAALLEDAEVVLDNGLGLNPWFEPLRGRVRGELVVVTDPLAGRAVHAVTEDQVDPHMWLAPELVQTYVAVIADALADARPQHADDFRSAADEVIAKLEALDEELAEILSVVPDERRLLVTHEDAFGYFAEAHDFEIVGTAVGPTTAEDPSAAGVAALIDEVRDRGVPAVFPQTTERPDTMARIAADAGATLGDPLHVDSVGEPGSDADTYFGMLRANAESLAEGLAP